MVSGVDLKPTEYFSNSSGLPYITGASNFVSGRILINRFTSEKYANSNEGDILLTCKGTIGEIALNDIGKIHVARQIMAIKPFIDKHFLVYLLKFLSPKLIVKGKSIIPGIDRRTILTQIVLIPPIKEQKMIVSKLNSLFDLI